MARPSKTSRLGVYLNGRLVGSLHKAGSGAISFQYDATWLNWEHVLPVSLSLPLQEQVFSGDVVTAVFENLLPDNDTICKRLAERVGAAGSDAFNLLASIGRDCVGALQFMPEGDVPGNFGQIEGRRVSDEEIAQLIKNLDATPLGITSEDDAFRISIAGAQEKTALLHHQGQWLMPHGSTPTTHILKPQIGRIHGVILT